MSINHLLKTPVEIYGNEEKVISTTASVQQGIIFLKDVDVRQLDIIKVIPTKQEFEVIDHPHKQIDPNTNRILYIEAKVRKSSG